MTNKDFFKRVGCLIAAVIGTLLLLAILFFLFCFVLFV